MSARKNDKRRCAPQHQGSGRGQHDVYNYPNNDRFDYHFRVPSLTEALWDSSLRSIEAEKRTKSAVSAESAEERGIQQEMNEGINILKTETAASDEMRSEKSSITVDETEKRTKAKAKGIDIFYYEVFDWTWWGEVSDKGAIGEIR